MRFVEVAKERKTYLNLNLTLITVVNAPECRVTLCSRLESKEALPKLFNAKRLLDGSYACLLPWEDLDVRAMDILEQIQA